MGFLSTDGAEMGNLPYKKDAKKPFLIIEKVEKYLKCPALVRRLYISGQLATQQLGRWQSWALAFF